MSLIYDEDGDPFGYAHEAEDGAIIATDFDGNIVGAVDPGSGQPIDHTEYSFAEPEPQYDHQAAQQLAEIQAAQQWQEQQQFAAAQQAQQQQAEQGQRLENDVYLQINTVEAQLGRQLTVAEVKTIGERMGAYLEAGREANAFDAIEQLEAEGKPLLNIDDRADRIEFMTQRVHENERAARGEDLYQDAPASQGAYDMDNHLDRVALMTDQLQGADVSDAVRYDSSGD